MKLRNKKTGEIDEFLFEVIKDRIGLYRRVEHSETKNIWHYNSLAELNAEWEDYEKSKDIWWLDNEGHVNHVTREIGNNFENNREIGNYFSSREEAEKAVEKLKAWKWLKDNGFKFLDYTALGVGEIKFEHNVIDEIEDIEQLEKDLDLLFGGEE